jgi:hypothetical protein
MKLLAPAAAFFLLLLPATVTRAADPGPRAGPPEAFWNPADPAPLGFVTSGVYNGPSYITQFKMNGHDDGVSTGNGNAITYVFGYAKPATNKKLSIWLTVGNNTAQNIASAIPIKSDGKFDLTLNPPQAAVSPGGSVTMTRFLICEYVAGTPGDNPLDKTTLYCGPWGSASYATDYDIVNNGLVVDKQNNNQDRMTRGTLYTTKNTIYVARSWVFDGPSTAQNPQGYPDVAYTWEDWGLHPPDVPISTYKVDKNCSGNGGSVFCDPAPSIKVNSDMLYQDAEFQYVYGGMFASGWNRTTILMAAAYRDELTLAPVVFEGLFDQPITIEVAGTVDPPSCASVGPADWLPAPALALALRGLQRRRRTNRSR